MDKYSPGSIVPYDSLIGLRGLMLFTDSLERYRAARLAALRAWVNQPSYGMERRPDGSTVLWLPAVSA